MASAQVVSDNTITAKRVISRPRLNIIKLNFVVDLILTVMFVVTMEEHFTGLALHELLGLLFAFVFIVHIILHWKWIVSITRTMFKKVLHESRLNYILNVALFVDMILVTVSGILISRTLGLNFSLGEDLYESMRIIHLVGSEFALVIVALHVAMHWKWIKTNSAKYLFGWMSKSNGKSSAKHREA